jgi:hypothetical protein
MPKTARTRTTAAYIHRMVKRIVKKFHPQQIILFGSHARGEAGPDSDVDLLVVLPVHGMDMQVLRVWAVATLGSSIPMSPLALRAPRARPFNLIQRFDPILSLFIQFWAHHTPLRFGILPIEATARSQGRSAQAGRCRQC